MFLLGTVLRLWTDLRIALVKRKGLQVAEDVRFEAFPRFGSEPYLISIGRHVAIADQVTFITHDAGVRVFRDQDERYRRVIKYGRITINENCVIGFGCILLPGVTIGPNSVVAAGSVVSRNVPPNVLAAGNPATPVLSIHQYAEWSLAATPEYDLAEYKRDKRRVLEHLPMKGSPPAQR
jgi:acetyltransferase-like isoleucine patch superfamily enzyme